MSTLIEFISNIFVRIGICISMGEAGEIVTLWNSAVQNLVDIWIGKDNQYYLCLKISKKRMQIVFSYDTWPYRLHRCSAEIFTALKNGQSCTQEEFGWGTLLK